MTRKRILFVYLGTVLCLVAGTWAFLTRSGVSRAFVENLLAKVIRRENFSLRDAVVDFSGGIVTLRGLEVMTSSEHPGRARMAIEQVDVGVETNPLGAPGRVQEVRIRGLELEIDLAEGRFPDLARLLAVSELGGGAPTTPPPLEIVESRLRLRLAPELPPIEFRDVQLRALPIEAKSSTVILSGTMRGPNGELVVVDGRADVAAPTLRVTLKLTDTPLLPESVMPYSRDAGDLLADIDAKGQLDSLVLWLEYPARTPSGAVSDGVQGGVRIDLSQVACDVPQFPLPVRDARARLSAQLNSGGTIRCEFEQRSDDGSLTLVGEIGGLLLHKPSGELRITARDQALDARLGRALSRIDDARLVWEAFAPTAGRADAEVRLELRPDRSSPSFSMDVDVRDAELRFVGFEARNGTRTDGVPLPLRDVTGRVHVREGEVVVERLSGRVDEGAVTMVGRIGTSPTDNSLRLHVESDALRMSPAIRDALASFDSTIAATWDEYSPQGSTRVEFDIRQRAAEPDRLSVMLRPQSASASWSGFPSRVDGIEGSIAIDDGTVSLDLRGHRGEAAIALRGRFLGGESRSTDDGPAAELALRTGPLTIDAELRSAMHALSGTLGDTIDRFELDGTVAVTLATWRQGESTDFDYDVRADLAGSSAVLALPVRSINGPVFVHGAGTTSHIELSGLRGEIAHPGDVAPSELLVQGTVESDATAQSMNVTAVVNGLPLDERLGTALDRIGALDLDTWRVLAPSGRVDVVWNRSTNSHTSEDHQRLRVQLLEVGSDAAFLPAPARSVFGNLEITDGVAVLADVRGAMADAEFTVISGRIAHERDATRMTIRIASDEFPVDDRLANLLSGPMRSTWLDRRVRGRVAINSLEVDMLIPDTGVGFETRLGGQLRALGVNASLGAELEDFVGRITIRDTRFDELGGEVHGTISGAAMTLFAHRTAELEANFDANPDRIVFRSLLGKLYGGSIQGDSDGGDDLVYEFASPGRLALALRWDGIDLARAMRESGAKENRMRGELSGRFRLERLDGANLADLVGEGEVRVGGGDLGAVPAFTAIYSYLAEPRRPRFDRLTVKARIAEQRISVESLELASPLLTATGKGTIDMAGWIDMRIDFPDLFGREGDWAVLPPVVRALTSGIAQFQIHGDLRSPQTRPLWLGRDAADRSPLGPIPASGTTRK